MFHLVMRSFLAHEEGALKDGDPPSYTLYLAEAAKKGLNKRAAFEDAALRTELAVKMAYEGKDRAETLGEIISALNMIGGPGENPHDTTTISRVLLEKLKHAFFAVATPPTTFSPKTAIRTLSQFQSDFERTKYEREDRVFALWSREIEIREILQRKESVFFSELERAHRTRGDAWYTLFCKEAERDFFFRRGHTLNEEHPPETYHLLILCSAKERANLKSAVDLEVSLTGKGGKVRVEALERLYTVLAALPHAREAPKTLASLSLKLEFYRDEVSRDEQDARNKEIAVLKTAKMKEMASRREGQAAKVKELEMRKERAAWLRSPEGVLTILVIAAQNGYCAEGFKNLSKAFRYDEQLWDAIKDRPGRGGMTPFIASVCACDLERTRWLLQRGARVNAARLDGMTALLLVCEWAEEHIILRQAERRKSERERERWQGGGGGSSLLPPWGRLDMARLLLEKGANVEAARAHDGMTALGFACERNDLGLARLLLESGAHPHAPFTNGSSPFLMAISKGHTEFVKVLLLAHGGGKGQSLLMSKSPLSPPPPLLAAPTTPGRTPLMQVCEAGQEEMAELLVVEGGANVNATSSDDGETALSLASREGHYPIVKLLIRRGARVNTASTFDGMTPLMHAVQNGCEEVVGLLLEWSAHVNASRSSDGVTPLHLACEEDDFAIARMLIDAGADVNAYQADDGFTPLMYAAMVGNVALAQCLVDCGAERGAMCNDGRTAHCWALRKWLSRNREFAFLKVVVEEE